MKDNTNWARLCDTCKSASSTIYCRVDSAYLCTGCDSRIHAPNQVASRHERVWVCESCERAPSAFLCKADSASLCTTCDADIHSANPLAHRHHRVPVEPIPGSLYGPRVTDPGGSIDEFMTQQEGDEQQIIDDEEDEDEEEAASWLLTNPVKNGNNQSNGFLFGGDQVDEYLDLMDQYDSNSPEDNQISDQFGQEKYSVPQKSYGGDSVVPVQSVQGQIQQQFMFQLGLEFESSKAAYSYNGSISPNVSSIDVGVVPNPTMSDISVSDSIPARKETIDFFNGGTINQMPTQLSPKDREARVLRYKEKKKTRKFEKTIRYASRKAYAETRPRIKGRFAKRTGLGQVQVDQMFSSTLMTETGYGIVPSF